MQKYTLMGFKGFYKDKIPSYKFGIFLMLIFASFIIHTVLAYLVIFLFTNLNFSITSLVNYSDSDTLISLKIIQLFSTIGLFVTPLLIYSYVTGFKFKWNMQISRRSLFLVLVSMLLVNPFVSFIYDWNMGLDLPAYLISNKNTELLTLAFLNAKTIWALFFNILVLAIGPALGEELFFRGYLQQQLSKILASHHLGIISSAILFSAIHFQFQAFFPRLALGILLGYFFYWSGSLTLAIIAHFFNNLIVVLFSYSNFSSYSKLLENNYTINELLFSLFGLFVVLFLLQKDLSLNTKRAD